MMAGHFDDPDLNSFMRNMGWSGLPAPRSNSPAPTAAARAPATMPVTGSETQTGAPASPSPAAASRAQGLVSDYALASSSPNVLKQTLGA